MVRNFERLLCLWMSVWISRSLGRNLDLSDIQNFVDNYSDEILSHNGLRSVVSPMNEDIPHPVVVHNWGGDLKLGQISGVSVNPEDKPVIFHRGSLVYDEKTFDGNNVLREKNAINEDTIFVLDPETGEKISSWGKGLFYMPHGLTIDSHGNTYVTDVGLHQVMRFPPGAKTPDLVLGKAFEPGNERDRFCKPTSVAVSEITGDFFVADGYCNSRVLKYNKDGELLQILNGDWQIAHSLALFEDEGVFCVANREGRKIQCYGSGLRRPFGQEVINYDDVGRVYGIAAKGTALVAVTGEPDPSGITIDTSSPEPKIIDLWGKQGGLSQPHDVAISHYGDAIYVVEIDSSKPNKLNKFEVVNVDEDEDMF